MKLSKYIVATAMAATVGIMGATSATAIVYPVNDGFEVPDLGSGGGAFAYGPGGATWSFVGGAGLAANGSAFGVSGASNGNVNGGATSTSGQAGFIQGGDGTFGGSVIEQVGLSLTGDFKVLFDMEDRPEGNGLNPIAVYLTDTIAGNVYMGTFTPAFEGAGFAPFATGFYTSVGTVTTVHFVGVGNGSDVTSFIDNVQFNTVPEPSTLMLIGLGLAGVFAGYRRTQK